MRILFPGATGFKFNPFLIQNGEPDLVHQIWFTKSGSPKLVHSACGETKFWFPEN